MKQLMGSLPGPLDACISRTAVAQITVAGIEYEAKRCLNLTDTGSQRFEGEWQLTISGLMNGTGTINASIGGGNWESTAFVATGTITQEGPAEIVSGGGMCAIKIRANGATGMSEGRRVRMPGGVAGVLPIKVVRKTCSVQPGKS